MKIGILTHYYKSENYGGNLQAYALCRVLSKYGHQAQQISLERHKVTGGMSRIKRVLKKCKNFRSLSLYINFNKRSKALQRFNSQAIPHSKEYSETNISGCVEQYDAFITGSDQVWHPLACCDAYLLKFVPSNIIKMSYAASVATDTLPMECREKYSEALKDYRAVSVREKETVDLIQDLSPVEVQWTLDPTLLLSREDWEQIAEPYVPQEKYIFCYFLGDDEKHRTLVREFAHKRRLKIVTLPHLLGKYRKCDANFGDDRLYKVSPGLLLSLIREAEYVFTDSFHASVFSLIYEKQHFMFQRSGAESMSVRLRTLTELFGTQDYFCYTEDMQKIEYVMSLPPVDYSKRFDRFEKARKASVDYLELHLA